MEIFGTELEKQNLRSIVQTARNKNDELKVATYVDVANVWNAALNRKGILDLRHIMNVSKTFGQVVIARAYICSAAGGMVNSGILNSSSSGFEIITRYVPNKIYGLKKDIDTNLVSDLLEDLFTVAPNVIVIASDDSDFVPAILKARKKGVKCISLVSSFEKANNLVGVSTSSYKLSFEESAKEADSVNKIVLDSNEED